MLICSEIVGGDVAVEKLSIFDDIFPAQFSWVKRPFSFRSFFHLLYHAEISAVIPALLSRLMIGRFSLLLLPYKTT